MTKILAVSPSPHVHCGDSVKGVMYHVIIALIPSLLWSVYVFGLDAMRVAFLCVASCIFFEYFIQKFFFRGRLTVSDGSAVITGLLLAFNLPSNLPVWIVLAGSFVAIAVGKMTFGGLGNNPFNPALVGRVFLLISFPSQMTIWPSIGFDGVTAATPLTVLKEAVKGGEGVSVVMSKLPALWDSFLGTVPGSTGEVSVICILLGFVYMLWKRVISWHIPGVIIFTIFCFQGLMNLSDSERFADPFFHVFSGGIMLGAVFMATDMVTSPMSRTGQIVYSVGIALITVIIRNFGAYPEGISFAILIMNGFTPLINNSFKPRRFGGIYE